MTTSNLVRLQLQALRLSSPISATSSCKQASYLRQGPNSVSSSQVSIRTFADEPHTTKSFNTIIPRKRKTGSPVTRQWKPPLIAQQRDADPVKIAEFTRTLLKKGERDKALELVRTASKTSRCVVSWNHIVNDCMQAGGVQAAFQTFNEMRKRGQKPDSYTYTILFRGLTANAQKTPTAVEKALSLLAALRAPESGVSPSTIHYNAALEVCAKARNLDAVYDIAAKLPEAGPGAPDHATYTIVLECLRSIASQPPPNSQTFGDIELQRIRQDSILQGKRIWADVVRRWQKGMLVMDELLVHAMGRLLLLGDLRNHDEILSLVEQTTSLTREIPEFGVSEQKSHIGIGQRSGEQLGENSSDVGLEENWSGTQPSHSQANTSAQNDFKVIDEQSRHLFKQPKRQQLRSLATPRNRILSILMRACGKLNAYAAGQKYWGIITAKVAPDLDNLHEYFRVLRRQRASRLAVELLRQICIPKDQDGFGLTPMRATFRLAMSVCARDGDNPRCLAHMRAVLKLQAEHIKVPDTRSGQIVVDLLRRRNGQWPVDEVVETMDAIDALWVNLKHFTAYGDGTVGRGRGLDREVPTATREAMSVLTLSYYRLIEESMSLYRERLNMETFRKWNERLSRNRNKLNRWKKVMREEWFVGGTKKTAEHDAGVSPA